MQVHQDLIKRCLKNDRRAQNALYKELFGFLMNICMRYKNNYDDAGAALNAIYMKVLDSLTNYNHKMAIQPWVKTIAIRHLIDEHRSDAARNALVINGIEQERDEWAIQSFDHLNAKDILDWIRQLEEPTRTVFNLYAIDGYKHREIAEMLDMAEGNSKWHLNKARKFLKECVQKEEERVERLTMNL